MVKEVLILGNPMLRKKSDVISDFIHKDIKDEITNLKDTLEEYRKVNGFGRAITAIQIGIAKRMIAINLGKGTFIIANPLITYSSRETCTLWDDCMSFPDLVVRVKRSKTVNIQYDDEFGKRKYWKDIGQAESELLQHEIDHLDGILAIERAIKKTDIVYKSEYNKRKEYYESMVDYKIVSTIDDS